MANDAVIICEGGKYIAIDQSTGGYPYRVSSPWDAEHWRSAKDAATYRSRFPKENWQIKVFRATPLWDIGEQIEARA